MHISIVLVISAIFAVYAFLRLGRLINRVEDKIRKRAANDTSNRESEKLNSDAGANLGRLISARGHSPLKMRLSELSSLPLSLELLAEALRLVLDDQQKKAEIQIRGDNKLLKVTTIEHGPGAVFSIEMVGDKFIVHEMRMADGFYTREFDLENAALWIGAGFCHQMKDLSQ